MTGGKACGIQVAGDAERAGASQSLSSATSVSSAVALSLPALSSVASVPSVVKQSPSASVTLSVDGLTLPVGDLPAGVSPAGATSGCAWIAYWLVDWEFAGEVFHVREWSGRPRDGATPPAALTHAYVRPGRHTIAVRAMDLLGGVSTATLDLDL